MGVLAARWAELQRYSSLSRQELQELQNTKYKINRREEVTIRKIGYLFLMCCNATEMQKQINIPEACILLDFIKSSAIFSKTLSANRN